MSEETFTLQESASAGGNDENGEKREYDPIPEGTILETELLGIEKKTQAYKDDNGNPVVKVEFAFRITEDGEYKNRRVWGQTPTTFTTHEDCKMRAWIQEILGGSELPAGFQFKPSDLIGSKARVVVGTRSYTTRDGVAKTVNFVGELMPSRALVSVASSPDPAKSWSVDGEKIPVPDPIQDSFGEEPF